MNTKKRGYVVALVAAVVVLFGSMAVATRAAAAPVPTPK